MAGPRFKLDLVTYDDLATLLPMPLAPEPSRTGGASSSRDVLDQRLAENAQLVEQLNAILTATDISYVHPLSSEVATTRTPSSALAQRLAARDPHLFQYAVEAEPGPAATSTPGPSAAPVVAEHSSQPDATAGPTARKAARSKPALDGGEKKRSCRGAAKQEVYALSGGEAASAAARLSAFLESSLAAAARSAGEGGSDDDDGDDGEQDGDGDDEGEAGGAGEAGPGARGRPAHRFRLPALRQLHQELLTAQSQGYLRLAPTAQLQALLAALHGTAAAGRNRLLAEDAEPKSPCVARVAAALEAVLCCLVVLSTPGLPASLYVEELLGRAVELTKYHLQYNVLATSDARFQRLYRPGSVEEDSEAPVKAGRAGRGRAKASASAGPHQARWCGPLAAQLEQALSFLAAVLGLVRLGAEALIPLVRQCLHALTVDSLRSLHYRALGLVVSVFRHHPLQRNTVVDELVQGVAAYTPPGKHPPRHYPLQSPDSPARIQMATALIMQLVQVTAELPAVDAGAAAAAACTHTPTRWADYFWHEVMARLPSARTAKSDCAPDLRAWLEALAEDLLAALPLPEWPGAALLLRRLIMGVNSEMGLRAADSGARLASVDLLGLLACRLCTLSKEMDAPDNARAVTSIVQAAMATAAGPAGDAAAPTPDKAEVVQQLLLEHLATSEAATASTAVDHPAAPSGGGAAAAGTSVACSARQLIACNMLAAHVKAAAQAAAQGQGQGGGAGGEAGARASSEAIVRYRQIYERQQSCLGTSTSGLPELPRASAVLLVRWLTADSVLGRSRPTLLRWLAEAGGGGRARSDAHAAAVRAKAIKLLAAAIEADSRVLAMADVQDGIRGALSDDSVLVREAAVDLIGRYISRSSELAVQYYDTMVRASEDAGLTVRKRAIRVLWECCVRCPDFAKRSDALMRIVARATDQEDTMRALVTKICSEIWFLPKFQIEDEVEVADVARRPEQRAAQLGEVVMAVYGTMQGINSLPLHAAVPIVVTIRGIVGEEGKHEFEAVRNGAKEVADALLARALELQGQQDQGLEPPGSAGPQLSGAPAPAPPDELFQCLLSLHVLCLADPRLLHRPADPQRVVRCLAPYVKELPPNAAGIVSRRKAERLLAVLAILDSCMSGLRHLDDLLAAEMVVDLRHLIRNVSHVQAVGVACQCLCSLARLKPEHRSAVRDQTTLCYTFLEADCLRQATSSAERRRQYPRFLYTLGTLCRHGAHMLDEVVEGSKHPTCPTVLNLLLRYYALLAGDPRRDMALQAIGYVFIARPQLAVDVAEVRPVLEGALSPAAPASLKSRCLMALTELLRAEEEALVGRQAEARSQVEASVQASTLPAAEGRALARRNGEGDMGSVTNGLMQMLWPRIAALAKDTTPPPPVTSVGGQTPPPTPSALAAASYGSGVRRRALDLIEVIIRGGIIVPWSAMPPLCVLATDPERDTAARALAVMRSIVSGAGNMQFMAGQVPSGVAEAYSFHCKLAEADRTGHRPASPDQFRVLVEGLSAVWSGVFQPDRALKAKYLTALLKPLDEGCCLASGSAAKSDPNLLSFLTYVVAELPYRKMDELLAVLTRLNEILSRRAEGVRARLQELRQAAQQGGSAAKPLSSVNGGAGAAPSASPLPPRGPASSGLAAAVKAALAVSLMLLLKQYLRMSYDLAADRVAKYDPAGPQRKVEEKVNALHNGRLRFNASKLRLDVAAGLAAAQQNPHLNRSASASGSALKAAAGPADGAAAGAGEGGGATAGGGAAPLASVSVSAADEDAAAVQAAAVRAAAPGVDEVYKVLKTLMQQDEADYRHAGAGEPAAGQAHGGGGGADGGDEAAIDLAELMAAPDAGAGASKPPLAARGSRGRGRGRGRGSRGGGAAAAATSDGAAVGRGRGRGRGRSAASEGGRGGRGSTSGARGRKRKARSGDSDGDSDGDADGNGDGGGGADGEEQYQPRVTLRRRLEGML